MIRPCLFNDDLAHTFDKSVEVAEKLGVGFLELRNINGMPIGQATSQDIKNIKAIAANGPVKIASVGSPVFAKGCTIVNDSMYKQQMEILEKVLSFCQELDVRKVRVFGFDKVKADFRNHSLEGYFDQVIDKLTEPVRMAEKAGVVLMFEPEFETYLGTAEDLSKVVKTFNSDYVKVCWDVGNAWNAGDMAYPDGYEFIKNDIAHVHIKDLKLNAEKNRVLSDRVVTGTGDIPWGPIFSALHKDGYDGHACIECNFIPWTADLRPYLMDRVTADVQGLKKILDDVGVPY